MKTKAKTKIMHQKKIQEGSRQGTITGETQWKKYKHHADFNNNVNNKNTFCSYGPPFINDLHCRLLNYSTETND